VIIPCLGRIPPGPKKVIIPNLGRIPPGPKKVIIPNLGRIPPSPKKNNSLTSAGFLPVRGKMRLFPTPARPPKYGARRLLTAKNRAGDALEPRQGARDGGHENKKLLSRNK
jgi:hypothetical protein